MLRKKYLIIAGCLLASSLPILAQTRTLPAVPFAPPFDPANYTEINVIDEDQMQGLSVIHFPGNCPDPVSPALGNNANDDGCAIQAALDEVGALGGGVVYLPEGTYVVDRTLLVGNNTWVVGAGTNVTTLKRGKTLGYFLGGTNHNCDNPAAIGKPGPASGAHILFSNTNYNCGNTGMVLADFRIDGTEAVDATLSDPGVAISFSAIEETHIWNLYFKDVPQDAIFFRNGGVNTSIMNNVIDGFNMRHYNGGGVNIEMYGNSHIGNQSNPTVEDRPPVLVMGNTIISRSEKRNPATEKTEIFAINFNRPTSNDIPGEANTVASPPRALIQDNIIHVTDGQSAIDCFDCINSMIMNNFIRSTQGIGNGLFTGVNVKGGNVEVLDNEIFGSRKQDDNAGISVGPALSPAHVLDADIPPMNMLVAGNIIKDKNLHFRPATSIAAESKAALEVVGITQFSILDNRLSGISSPPSNIPSNPNKQLPPAQIIDADENAPGLVIGDCQKGNIPTSTHDGLVAWNTLDAFDIPTVVPTDSELEPYQEPVSVRRATDTVVAFNSYNTHKLTELEIEGCHYSLNVDTNDIPLPEPMLILVP